MKRHNAQSAITAAAIGALTLGLTGNADAGLVVNETIIVNGEPTEVTVQFVGADSPLSGALYFLGSGDAMSVIDPQPDTSGSGLGMFLFHSDFALVGETMFLGTFNDGDVLHFAYELKDQLDFPAPPAYRTDDTTSVQFAYDSVSGLLGVDDIPRIFSDQDYDDMQIRLVFNTVPAPAAGVVLGWLLVGSRRRRQH